MEQSGIFIQFSYNGNEIEGISEFKKELSESYPCQSNNVWLPSCSEGGEFWVKVLLGGSFSDFAAGLMHKILVGAVVYCGRKISLKPLQEALANLRKSNKDWSLNIREQVYVYDDFEVAFKGLQEYEMSKLPLVYKQIADSKPIIGSDMGIKRIELPFFYNEGHDAWYPDDLRYSDKPLDKCCWHIIYLDHSEAIFNSETKELIYLQK